MHNQPSALDADAATLLARIRQQLLEILPEPLRGPRQGDVDAALGELVAALERSHERRREVLQQQLAQQGFLLKQFEELVESMMQKPGS